jgi:hypothetical protein
MLAQSTADLVTYSSFVPVGPTLGWADGWLATMVINCGMRGGTCRRSRPNSNSSLLSAPRGREVSVAAGDGAALPSSARDRLRDSLPMLSYYLPGHVTRQRRGWLWAPTARGLLTRRLRESIGLSGYRGSSRCPGLLVFVIRGILTRPSLIPRSRRRKLHQQTLRA